MADGAPPPPRNLGDALDRTDQARLAVIDLGADHPPRRLTYGELDALADGFARLLSARGLVPGDRVAILAANRAEFLAAFLGAMRAGLVAVPVNFKLPAATVAYVLHDCDAKLVLADAPRLPLCPPEIPTLQFSEQLDAGLDLTPFTPIIPAPTDPAMFLYTSGSTGRPKGVVLSHHSHLWVLDMRRRAPVARASLESGPETPRQRALVAAPLYHMNALAVCQAALVNGDEIVLLPSFDAPAWIDAIDRYRPTALTSVPTMIAMMLREQDHLARADLSSVTAIRMGSAPVAPSLLDAVRALLPSAAITNGYGTTEAGPIVFAPHPDGRPTPPVSVGAKHPEVDLRLVVNGQETTEGVLEMRCPALMTEYHNLPEATRDAFTDDGYYITGDVFRRDENGFHYFLGRADDMFNSGGENIWPGEIEALLERHPAIRQAVVVPVPDDLKGQKPVAFVVLRPGAQATEADLKSYALANAAPYLHPRRVWFLDQMPLAGTNKIDRNALRQAAQSEGNA